MSKRRGKPPSVEQRMPTRKLEALRPRVAAQAEASQKAVDVLVNVNPYLTAEYPEMFGALVIAERARDRARDRLERIDAELDLRGDRFDLDQTIDEILEGRS